MTTVNTDAKFNGLGRFGYRGAQEDRELQFYRANGATSNSLADAEAEFLSSKGFRTGTVEDRWEAYLSSLGYTGTKDDMIYPWWGEMPGSSAYLDFTKPSPFTSVSGLDPRITFSRASNATVTGSNGLLQYAPHNLLPQSESFDNAAWSKNLCSVSPNVETAPNGSVTADRITASSSSSFAFVFNSAVNNLTGTFTVSAYIKQGSQRYVQFCSTASAAYWANFDLQAGLASAGGTTTNASITNVGDGWNRCTLTVTDSATNQLIIGFVSSLTSPRAESTTLTTNFFVWGAQGELGSVATAYYPTTVKNLLGFTQEFDNAAWTKSNSFVQTNFIRNNTMQGAVAGTPGTLPTNWTYEGSGLGTLSQQVVGVGIQNGINYIDLRIFGTSSVVGLPIAFESRTAVAAASGQTWTHSLFLALVAGSTTNINNIVVRQVGRTSAGAAAEVLAGGNIIGSLTANLQRFTQTATFTNATTAFDQPNINIDFASGVAIDITLRIGMPQLVQGATAGDVVATYGTAAAVGYAAPDGSITADKLVENTANAVHQVQIDAAASVASTIYRTSVYLKAGERTRARLVLLFGGGNGIFADVNLALGTIGVAASFNTATAGTSSIELIGNGWYRCSVSGSSSAGGTLSTRVELLDASGNRSYTGDGTSGILIWGAQLSDSASLDPYVYNPVAAPASTAYFGPRFDYDPVTLAPRGLLIEEQRTNLVLRSEEFNDANWVPTGVSVTANSSTSPSGATTADTLTADGATSSHFLGATDGAGAKAVSVYAKAGTGTFFQIAVGGTAEPYANFNLNTGTSSAFGTGTTASITAVGNGWYRCVMVTTNAAATAVRFAIVSSISSARLESFASSATVLLWGAQSELGAFPTSYIPTTTAAATRAADVATMIGANFSNWYNQTEGTMFADFGFVGTAASKAQGIFSFGDGTSSNLIYLGKQFNLQNAVEGAVLTGGTGQAFLVSSFASPSMKVALAVKVNDIGLSLNGLAALTDTSALIPVVNTASIGAVSGVGGSALNGHIRRIAYYPRRLANSELQGITA
jgi:hypothetical protein